MYIQLVEPYQDKISIKAWAEEDRPREKLNSQGRRALTDAELIAILIGSGSRTESAVELSKRILHHYGNDLNKLGKASVTELSRFKGIGEAKAISIIAAMELGRRRRNEDVVELTKITSSKAVFGVMHPIIGELSHEEFWVLFLNNSNKILFKSQLSKGGMTGTMVDVRIVFKIAFEQNATAIILTHNHPSGKLQASDADIQITKKIKTAGQQLDIPVLDHIIITENGYYSFADEGIF